MQILDEITLFMERHPAPTENWYAGTASDGRAELFNVHGFKAGDVGLYRNASTSSEAASLAAFLVHRGTKGDGKQKPRATSVYVFKMTRHTTPAA